MRRLTPQERGQLNDLRMLDLTGDSVDVEPWEVPILVQLRRDGLVSEDGECFDITDRGRRALSIDDALTVWEASNVNAA